MTIDCMLHRKQWTSRSGRGSLLLQLTFLFLLSSRIKCNDSLTFEQTVNECPSSTNTVGYTSLDAINLDMENEFVYLKNGGESRAPYVFVLCPNTTYDASATSLLPMLSDSVIICGYNGNVRDDCILSGGEIQVVVNDHSTDITTKKAINDIRFIGITFSNFTNSALSGNASFETSVKIIGARFQVRVTFHNICCCTCTHLLLLV